jgi:shikimate dehydrogenase
MVDPSFEINGSTHLYALIGSPVRHSLSPLIHNTSFKALGMNCAYVALDVRDLAEALIGLKALGFRGYNVTVPYKETVIRYLDELSVEARVIGSVNTVVYNESKWIGHNTDAAGFSKTLEPYRKEIEKKTVLVLGAGGGARAVIYALITNYEPREIVIHNRTKEHGSQLVKEFTRLRPEIRLRFASSDDMHDPELKMVINATSVGLSSDDNPITSDFFKPGMIAYDLIYHPPETTFLRQARTAGALGINGLEMLIEQAAAAFTLWTQAVMPVETVKKILNQKS